MNFIIYILPVKSEGQGQGCIVRQSMVFIPLGVDSPVKGWAIIQLLLE